MQAVELKAHGSPGHFELIQRADLVPGDDEVVVRVRACGLNHLDLWLEQGALPIPIQLPRIPGSEIAGEVWRVGPNVSEWKEGDRVAVQSNLFCGKCEFCEAGDESLCLDGKLLGVQLDGGFADQVRVPAAALVRIPDGVDFTVSAAVTLAGSTAIHMLTNRIEVRSGQWVLAIAGASGVGSAAIQIARSLGAYVIATASSPEKRALAARLGATHVVDSQRADWAAEVRRLTGKRGVDVVVEHVGGPVIEQAFHCLARGGTIVTCGATAGKEVTLQLWPFFVKQQRLVGSYGRNRTDIVNTLEWVASGRLQPVIHEVVPLSETAHAFARLRARGVLGKLVVAP
jgi:NADPH:quinone reductase-like Zn-dependent oxidoreductase